MRSWIWFLIANGCLASQLNAAAVISSLSDITHWTGAGENRAVIIIDWKDDKHLPGESLGEALAWGYRWPAGQTRTGRDALLAIAASDPGLVLHLESSSQFGTYVFGMYYDLDGDGGTATFDPVNEEGAATDPDDHFAEGWRLNGYWSYVVGASASTSRPAFTLSGSGDAFRTLTDGSWDAWIFNAEFALAQPVPGEAVLAPVPEPSSAPMLALAAAAVLVHRRRP